MYKRRTKGSSLKSSSGSSASRTHNHGSDIVAPNNTSLIVQRSRPSAEIEEELPKSVTAILYEDDSSNDSMDLGRPSTSFYNSLKGKTQSTPQKTVERSLSTNVIGLPSQSLSSSTYSSGPMAQSSSEFFLTFISKCGANEINGEGSYILSIDQAVFVRKINEMLSGKNCVDQFASSLAEYWSCNDNLKKLLMLTQTDQECEVARGPVQEPLLRLLLMVDCLQSTLLKLLLNKISNITRGSEGENERALLISGILRQVRCLNRVPPTPHFGTELLSLIDVSPNSVAKEIIFILPELIVQEERADVASQLVNRLHGGKDITGVVIDCLGNLSLNDCTRADVRNEMLEKLERYSITWLPSIVHFVLSRVDNTNALQIVAALRKKLLNFSSQRPSFDGPAGKINREALCRIFENLKNLLMTSKLLADVWIKEINNLPTALDCRPIDLMVLSIIHGYLIGRKSVILTTTRNRVKCGVFTEALVAEFFKDLQPVILSYHREVMEYISALMKSYEPSVADFTIAMYRELFTISNEFFRQDVISDVVMHITTGSSSNIRNALSFLLILRETDKKTLDAHAATFMTALRVLLKLELHLARRLVDIVASVIMTELQEDTGLIEELLIFVRKQMYSWQEDAQHRGVIAAIMIIKHAALNVVDDGFHDKFELKFLLKMASGAQAVCGSRRGFFLDELASTMATVPARPAILTYWGDRVLTYILQHYFASNLDLECDHFPMSLQFSIENCGSLVLPLVGFVNKPDETSYIDVWSLPAALRLLWCAEKDLSRIDELLSAAVILPDLIVFEKFLSFSPATQKIIMDCLFLCANYFIECINALSSVKPSEKVIIRVKQLIEVRKIIVQHVGLIPEYSPPQCQFHAKVPKVIKKSTVESKKPRGRKRKSDGAAATGADNPNNTQLDTSVMPATAAAAPADAIAQLTSSHSNTELAAYAGYFRELNAQAFRLLRMPLVLNPTKVYKKKKISDILVADVSWSFRPEDKPELGPNDTLFLLEDYLVKSDALLREKPPFVVKKCAGLITEYMTAPMFITGCVKLLPKFCLKLDVASQYCKDLLEANDGIWDATGCFPPNSAEIKACYCAVLNIIADILAWKGLQCHKNQRYLTDIMATLARKNSAGCTQSHASLAVEAAERLAELRDSVPMLWGGVCLTRAIHSCIQLSGTKDFALVGDVCSELLKRPWFTSAGCRDSGATYNQHIDSLVRLHLTCVADRLGTVLLMAQLTSEEVPDLVSKDASLPSYAALTKGNFAVLYRAMCEATASATTAELSRRSNDEDLIRLWGDVTKILTLLVDIAKGNSSRAILSALLKRSQAIISAFLMKGMPVIEAALRVKSEDVLCILKTLQGVTRFFNAVCCHSKMTKDAVIAAHVPHIRALCERLTLEVKGVFILNKIPLDCITISVLRNRDLQGNDIPSQTNMDNSDDESELPEEESELPEDLDLTVDDD